VTKVFSFVPQCTPNMLTQETAVQITEVAFRGFVLGSISIVAGGLLFEARIRYAKTGFSDQYKSKAHVVPFLLSIVAIGYVLERAVPVIFSVTQSIPPLSRVGIIGFSTMAMFNYSVPHFEYTDRTSIAVYLVAFAITIYPYVG